MRTFLALFASIISASAWAGALDDARTLGAPMESVERAIQLSRGKEFSRRDVLAVFDISQPSGNKRFFLIDLKNDKTSAHYAAHVYKIAGVPEEAVLSFERAMRLSPVDPQLHTTLVGMGMAFIELSRFDEAIVAGKKAQRLNPSFATAYRCQIGRAHV